MAKRALAELIGTFLFCLFICLTSMGSHVVWAPWVGGLVLASLIYANGHISGAHLNPMVTLSLFLRGKVNLNMVPTYILTQLGGGALAALISMLLINKVPTQVVEDLSTKTLEAILSEFLGSLAIAYVILNVTTSKNTQGNDYYGIAIGLSYAAVSSAFGEISGGILNPALALAVGITKLSSFSNLWIYWVGQFLGGVMAAVLFLFINGKD